MKQFLKTLGILSVVISLAFVFSTSTPVTAADTIKMGIIYALTGKGSALGTKQMDSAKLAIKEINAKGGADFGGKKVKIDAIYQDTETKPDAAVRKMKSMIKSDKITALVGGTFAHVSLAMNAQSRRTPIVYPISGATMTKISTISAWSDAVIACASLTRRASSTSTPLPRSS